MRARVVCEYSRFFALFASNAKGRWNYRDSTRETRLKKITLPYDPLSMSPLLKVAAHFMLLKWPYSEIQFA